MRPLIVFDFDGTVVDSIECFVDVANDILIRCGLSERLDCETMRNESLQRTLRRMRIPFWRIPSVIKEGRSGFASRLVRLRPHADLVPVLRGLQKRADLAIVSSNSADNIRTVLASQGIDDLFVAVEEGSIFGKHRVIKRVWKRLGKPRALYVGDEMRDVLAARRAGLPSCAITWGYSCQELLLSVRPTMIAATPREFEKLAIAWIVGDL